jgi:hypothetical protein
MARAEATVEELVGMIERGELRLPEMQRRHVLRTTRVRVGRIWNHRRLGQWTRQGVASRRGAIVLRLRHHLAAKAEGGLVSLGEET